MIPSVYLTWKLEIAEISEENFMCGKKYKVLSKGYINKTIYDTLYEISTYLKFFADIN
jgi:hypothetical protein